MNIKTGPTSLRFTFREGVVTRDDKVRIVFARYWWSELAKLRKKARSPRRKAALRKEMRQVAAYMNEMMKESR